MLLLQKNLNINVWFLPSDKTNRVNGTLYYDVNENILLELLRDYFMYIQTIIPNEDYDTMKKELLVIVDKKYHSWLKEQFNFENHLSYIHSNNSIAFGVNKFRAKDKNYDLLFNSNMINQEKMIEANNKLIAEFNKDN